MSLVFALPVPAIRHLHRSGHSGGESRGVLEAPVTSGDADAGVLLEPSSERGLITVGQEVQHLSRFEIHEDRAVRAALA